MKDHSKYQLLVDYIRKNKVVYLLGLLSVVVCNICQVYFATAMGRVVDFFAMKKESYDFFLFYTSNRDFTHREIFHIVFWSIFISRIILTIARFGWRITLARQTHLVSGLLKNKIWSNARFFKIADLVSIYPKGVLMNAANSDVGQARFLFGFTLVGVIDMFFLGVFTVISMLFINMQLTVVSVGFLLMMPVFVRKLSKLEIENYEIAQQSLSDFNDLSSQAISTVKLQKLGKTSVFWFKRLLASASEYMDKRVTAQSTSLKYIPYMGVSSIVSYIVLFSYGIYLNVNGVISVGEFVSMQGLIFLLQDPLMELGFIISEWRKSATSLKRLSEIYVHENEDFLNDEKNVYTLEQEHHVYEIKDLNFSYNSERQIISDFSLSISSGNRIGITGKIGSGKSTLIDILSGLQRNFKGEVLFFGKEFKHYDHLSLRELIVTVHQKSFLFADSIKKNVAMDQDLTDDEVWQYLKIAGLDKDVRALDDGLETGLGEWGINLSGGQKQRLTLARALAKKPKILLIDDGLSAVDTVTEELILNNLIENLKDTTIIWVAHRRSTLKHCDVIIDMDEL
ncbi:ABC transporter ATP-binding protein [Bacteriovorax sp. Seq25_V]|uniref:ABC transporter ATP-binding protein n=1 Tax=Bacteriovorax sp. Seq25_V TaxID=1201288 RepID=UPI00038A22D6|nr:ABC transporter ATP-binding protein [Bacteriovorax sp. Seq25_V]EQC47745.1 ABC transporter, ATP-binding protein [Bacteriovorax sp. Seq25_V]